MTPEFAFRELMICRTLTTHAFQNLNPKSGPVFMFYTSITDVRTGYATVMEGESNFLSTFGKKIKDLQIQVKELDIISPEEKIVVDAYTEELEVVSQLLLLCMGEDIDESVFKDVDRLQKIMKRRRSITEKSSNYELNLARSTSERRDSAPEIDEASKPKRYQSLPKREKTNLFLAIPESTDDTDVSDIITQAYELLNFPDVVGGGNSVPNLSQVLGNSTGASEREKNVLLELEKEMDELSMAYEIDKTRKMTEDSKLACRSPSNISSSKLTVKRTITAIAPATFHENEPKNKEEKNTKYLRDLAYWKEMMDDTIRIQFEDFKTESGEIENRVVSGDINHLVQHYLCHFGYPSFYKAQNFEFPKIFLRSLRWFTTPKKLFEKFLEVYLVPDDIDKTPLESMACKTSVCMGIRFWCQQGISDFAHVDWAVDTTGKLEFLDPEMKELIEKFFGILKSDASFQNSPQMIELIRRTFDRSTDTAKRKKEAIILNRKPEPPPKEVNYDFHFNFLPLQQVADQLTLIEFEVLSRIQLKDLKAKKWEKMHPSCPVYQMILHFNSISFWVVSTILSFYTPSGRAQTMVKFAKLAQILRDRYNYNTMMAIDGALQHTTIERLKKTIAELSDKDEKILSDLKEFTTPNHNFREYRERQRNRIGFCIPYIGLYLRDLIYTEDGEDTWIKGGGIINFKKLVSVAASTSEIVRCQEIAPGPEFAVLPNLRNICEQFIAHDVKEDDLYRVSKEVEPRESGVDKNKEKRPVKKIDQISASSIFDILNTRYFKDKIDEIGCKTMMIDIPSFHEFDDDLTAFKNKNDWIDFLQILLDTKKKYTITKQQRIKQKLVIYLCELVQEAEQ